MGSHKIPFNSIRRFLLQRPSTFCVIKKLYRTDTSGMTLRGTEKNGRIRNGIYEDWFENMTDEI